MLFSDLFRSSIESLQRTKGRSALTMIGIVIGIMAVILMLSIGQAAERYITAEVSSLGSDVLFIGNGSKETSGEPTLFVKSSLVEKDVRKLRQQIWVTAVAGKVLQSDGVSSDGIETSAQIVGTTPDEMILSDIRAERGRFFDQSAVDGRAREAVIGSEIASVLYGMNDPLGKSLKINNVSYRVIGTMQKKGANSFQNLDKQIYVPFTAAMDTFNKQYLSSIVVKTSLPISEAKERLTITVRESHNIDNPTGDLKKDDFNVTTQEDAVKSAQQITDILQVLLISIAAISLLVGGIGIMNIMYVSVTERIKEIGLRKSIGARERDILRQFLIEAVLQTTIGGLIGTFLGISLSWGAIQAINAFQPGWTFEISWSAVGLSLGVSGAIGLVFGYFPARKAAKLHPIEALRFE
ncbi:MAG: Macrolide export ATP-binding/permease protein MacB [Patescibacteria group bacterium]|nr:Macrolide export ATP-binding/permease protein MacB [Patescibacteria group bacterium]